MNCKFQNKFGLYLGYFDFFSESFSKLEFKNSPIQVHVIPNLKLILNFKTNLGCIRVILMFSLTWFLNWNLRNPQFSNLIYQDGLFERIALFNIYSKK